MYRWVLFVTATKPQENKEGVVIVLTRGVLKEKIV